MIALANHGYPRKIVGSPGFTGGACLRKDFGMPADIDTIYHLPR